MKILKTNINATRTFGLTVGLRKVRGSKQKGKSIRKKLEAISKIGFWFNFEAGPRFEPEEYYSILRIQNEAPTKKLGQKTFLRWLLYMLWQFKATDPGPHGRNPSPVFN